MTPYIGLSRGPRGSFIWAMDQVRAGNEVRREGWPIEVEPRPTDPPGGFVNHARIWHLYDVGGTTICKGFNSGVCGADNDSWGDLGVDSHGYTPSTEDIIALDWQFVSEVTPEQIAELDANRVPRYPSEVVAAWQDRQRPVPGWLIWLLVLLLAGAVCVFWSAIPAKAEEACLLLKLGSGTKARMVPVATPFPSQGDCEKAAGAMADGKTVTIGVCLPLAVYDCRKAPPALESPVPVPKPRPALNLDRSA